MNNLGHACQRLVKDEMMIASGKPGKLQRRGGT